MPRQRTKALLLLGLEPTVEVVPHGREVCVLSVSCFDEVFHLQHAEDGTSK